MKTSLTLDDIQRVIVAADYHQFPGTTLTVCCLTLADGFNVVGQSACIDPATFDAAMGRKIANDDAVNKVCQLEGYLLNYKIKHGVLGAEADAQAAADDPAAVEAAENQARADKATADDKAEKAAAQAQAEAEAAAHAEAEAAAQVPTATDVVEPATEPVVVPVAVEVPADPVA